MLGTFENAMVVVRQSAGIHLFRTLLQHTFYTWQHTWCTHAEQPCCSLQSACTCLSLQVHAVAEACMLSHTSILDGIEYESPVAARQAVAAACLTTPERTVDRVYQSSVLR